MKRLTVAVAAAVAMACAAGAFAQSIDTRHARTIVVGAPRGAAPAERVDGSRSGAARTPLPGGTLHVAWRRSLGLPLAAAPLVDARGDVTIVAARGDVVVLAGGDGEERAHTLVGAAATSGGALLTDGTVVLMTSQGDVVGVRLGDVRFRTRVGGGRTTAAPLALDDGGFVVATPSELIALDGEGGVRARAAIDAGTAPIALALGHSQETVVYAVFATTGEVYGWMPASGREAARVGSFRGGTDDGAAVAADGSLVAVVGGEELVALDPAHGTTTACASTATTGLLALLGPPATLHGATAILGLTASRTIALSFDAACAETVHQAVGSSSLPPLPDGGFGHAAAAALASVGPLLDAHGAIAFALPSGEIGVVSTAGAVDVVNDVCTHSGYAGTGAGPAGRASATFAGLSPAAPSAMVVACAGGVVARLDDDFAHVR